MKRALELVAATVATLVIAGCGPEPLPKYSPPSNGPTLKVVQEVDTGTDNSPSVALWVYNGNCDFTLLGELEPSQISGGVTIPSGKDLVVGATFDRSLFVSMLTGNNTTLTETRVFSSKNGADYTLKLIYNRMGYAVDVLENGIKLPFRRACGY